jgi:hypothetical protein
VAGANAIQVAVSDGQGRNASASQVVFLQPALTVTVEPATIAAGTEVEFTVRAKDAATGTTVDDATGVVLIDGIIVGRLGRPIKHKFQVQPARGRRREQVVVRVAPYAEADVPLVFERAPDDRECAQLKEEIAALRLELDRLGGRARRDKQAELEQLLARSRQLRCR